MATKFSEFTGGGEAQVGDVMVGLRDSVAAGGDINFKFDFPGTGIKDAAGGNAYLVGWTSVGPLAVNYVQFGNAATGSSPTVKATGTDTNISLLLSSTGSGDVISAPATTGFFRAIGTNAIILPFGSTAEQPAGETGGFRFNTTLNELEFWDPLLTVWTVINSGGPDGDVFGPALSTDDAVVRFDGVTGKLIKNGIVLIDDAGKMDGLTSFQINGSTFINDFTDDDSYASATANNLASAESTKVYINAQIAASGGGDVFGPALATDDALARFDGVTGKLIQNSLVTLDDAGAISGLTQLDVDNIRIDGNAINSTDVNGNISIAPNGTGEVLVPLIPVSNAAAASRQYVDALVSGLTFQAAADVGSTVDLNSAYLNGAAGVGATLTSNVNGVFLIDGINPAVTDRVLVKDQALQVQNGIYTVTDVGTGGTPFILTRALDYDLGVEIQAGDILLVKTGTINALTTWIQLNNVTTVGTDPLDFIQFSFGQTFPTVTVLSLTPDRAVVSDATKQLVSSVTTTTELSFVNGVTSSIQTQLNGKISQSGAQIFAADTGAADAYVVTLAPVPAGLVAGLVVNFTATNASTGASTLNLNALGAAAIFKNASEPLIADDIKAAQVVSVIYDGAQWQMASQTGNAGGSGSGSAVAKLITQANAFAGGEWVYLVGSVYTIGDNTSDVTAEIVGVVAFDPAPTGADFTLQTSGFHTGDAGLVAGSVYFLGLAGALTLVPPTELGEVVKPLLSADTTTSGIMLTYRGDIIGETVPPPSGDFVLLATATANAAFSIDFTGLSSTHIEYQIVFTDIVVGTDAADLNFLTSTDAGVSYDTGVSDYAWGEFQYGISAPFSGTGNSAADARIRLINALGTGANESVSGSVTIYNPSAATFTRLSGFVTGTNSSPTTLSNMMSGVRLSAADVDAVRFIASTGTIASGEFRLYGLKGAS